MKKTQPLRYKKRFLIPVVLVILLLSVAVAEANRDGMSFNELKAPPSKPPLLPGQVSETYPVGFYGLIFNMDGQNTLELDLGAARTANAEVTTYSDRVEIYQHSSPAVLITFHGKDFEYRNGKIFGNVKAADFVTSPLAGNISDGDVTGLIQVELLALNGRADCINMIDANVTADLEAQFSAMAAAQDLDYTATAFTFNITKVNLANTGTANLTFTVPSQWVASHGGVEHLYVARISEKDRTTQLLNISYLGEDTGRATKFTANSPNGTSVFGIISTKAQLEHGIEPFLGQIATDIGLLAWISQLVLGNMYLVGAGAITATGVFYLGRKRIKNDR